MFRGGDVVDVEVQAELGVILERLESQPENPAPELFKTAARTTIAPALSEIAQFMSENGIDCRVRADVEDTVTDQSVCLLLDSRYSSGAHPLCFRLTPGEALVRLESSAGGAICNTQHVPLTHLTREHVQRLAVDFLKHVV
jgi:hypothetical protein